MHARLIRSRIVLGLAAALMTSAAPCPVGAEVLPWSGRGLWFVATTLDCFGEPIMGGFQGSLRLQQLGPAAVLGTWSAGGTFEGEVLGKRGYKLKGRVDLPECGQGKFTFKLLRDFSTFTGTLKFPGAKGKVVGAYFYDEADRYDAGLRLAFAAAKKGFIKVGKSAVLAVFLENAGPQPIPLGTLLLRLRFSGAVGFQKVAILKRLADYEFGVDLDPAVPETELALPIAAGDLLILAVKFRVPDELAGSTLRVDADLLVDPDALDVGQPFVPAAMASAEIDVEGLTVTLKLRNQDTENIHIFLAEDKPDDWFSARTFVRRGRSKRRRLTGRRFGEQIVLRAGRNGNVLGECTMGMLARSGKATVVWDPRNASLSGNALRCPGE